MFYACHELSNHNGLLYMLNLTLVYPLYSVFCHDNCDSLITFPLSKFSCSVVAVTLMYVSSALLFIVVVKFLLCSHGFGDHMSHKERMMLNMKLFKHNHQISYGLDYHVPSI